MRSQGQRLIGVGLLLTAAAYAATIDIPFPDLNNNLAPPGYNLHTNAQGNPVAHNGFLPGWTPSIATALDTTYTLGHNLFVDLRSALLNLSFAANAAVLTATPIPPAPPAPSTLTFTSVLAATGTITISSGASSVSINANSVTGFDVLANLGSQIALGNGVTVSFAINDDITAHLTTPTSKSVNDTYQVSDVRTVAGINQLITTPARTPEPFTTSSVCLGLAAIGFMRRRKSR